MEVVQAKLGEMQQNSIINTPESLKSNNSSSTASSNFTFEADLLPIDLSHDLFELQIEVITEKIEDMMIKYNNCCLCLQDVISKEILLQEENLNLRAENIQLSSLINEKETEILLESLSISSGTGTGDNMSKQIPGESTRKNENEAVNVTRGVLPKTISVRSTTGLSKINKQSDPVAVAVVVADSSNGTGTTRSDDPPHRLRLIAKSSKEGEESEEGGGLEVYKQGMLKTELCNKWEETGECPYGERCQFAHGMKELRPVLRHPRYKTEICRMISSGGTCPYGHRCHFRHTLDPNQEKEVVL